MIENWGLIDYLQAYERQRRTVDEVITGAPDRLIFCEHPPVITLGRMTKPDSLLYNKDQIQSQGVRLESIDRGGDVTLHAPGQLVVYPIINLNKRGRDLKTYLQKLEQVAVDLLKDFGILAISIPGQRGVFVGKDNVSSPAKLDKIVSIGIGVRKWVTYHGLGINVHTDLSLFRLIRPCGLSVEMTSMQKLLGRPVELGEVEAAFVKEFQSYG